MVLALVSPTLHCGAVPRDAPAGSTRVITFAAIATRRVDYETTVPVIPPSGQKALATTAAAVPEGHALYTGVVQPRGEGRPAAEVFRL